MQLGDKKLISQEINSVSNRKSPCVIRTQDVRITCGNRKAVRIAITSPNRLPFFFLNKPDTLPNRVWSKLQFAVDKIIFKIHVKRFGQRSAILRHFAQRFFVSKAKIESAYQERGLTVYVWLINIFCQHRHKIIYMYLQNPLYVTVNFNNSF